MFFPHCPWICASGAKPQGSGFFSAIPVRTFTGSTCFPGHAAGRPLHPVPRQARTSKACSPPACIAQGSGIRQAGKQPRYRSKGRPGSSGEGRPGSFCSVRTERAKTGAGGRAVGSESGTHEARIYTFTAASHQQHTVATPRPGSGSHVAEGPDPKAVVRSFSQTPSLQVREAEHGHYGVFESPCMTFASLTLVVPPGIFLCSGEQGRIERSVRPGNEDKRRVLFSLFHRLLLTDFRSGERHFCAACDGLPQSGISLPSASRTFRQDESTFDARSPRAATPALSIASCISGASAFPRTMRFTVSFGGAANQAGSLTREDFFVDWACVASTAGRRESTRRINPKE